MVFTKEINLKNYEIIDKLVSNHFSLNASSLSFFQNKLYNPVSDETINNLFKDCSEDDPNRIYFSIPEISLDDIDEGWKIFTREFSLFKNHFNIQFENYRKNKIVYNKNEYKLKKLLELFYLNFNEENKKNDYFYSFSLRNSIHNFNTEINEENKVILLNRIETEIKDKINNIIEEIGRNKIPTSHDLKICISRDFADWFLCSTSESWRGSCLSLNSSTEACYWAGLPGLVGDPNRLMIYITDGKEKEFHGIKTNRTISRSWLVLDNTNFFHIINWYPNDTIKTYSLNEITGLNFYDGVNDWKSKCPIDILWHTNGFSLSIYQDNSTWDVFNGKVYVVGSCSGYIGFSERNIKYITEDSPFEYYDGLSGLISGNMEISEANSSKFICDCCGDSIYDNEDYYEVEGQIICSCCYEYNTVECEECGEAIFKRSAVQVGNEIFCQSCFDDFLTVLNTIKLQV